MSHAPIDVLVVGAGPYGLSVSAHLRKAGVEHKVMGKTMDSWHRMPEGMCLRSPARASSLSDPDGVLTLEEFHRDRGVTLGPPVPLESFIEYGHWFAERAGIEVDSRFITALTTDDGTYAATLDDGEVIRSRRVVLAVGAEPFQLTPPEFQHLPRDQVSHTGEHESFSHFVGKRLIIVGTGQGGVECAALAAESGAEVQVLTRAHAVRWLTRSARLHGSALGSLLYARSDVGPAGLSRVVGAPGLFRVFPSQARVRMTRRCARPAAAAWLVERTQDIPFRTSHRVRSVTTGADGVCIECDNGSSLYGDHVLLATGYEIDVAKWAFLDPELRARIKTVSGFPVLRRGMMSSVAGLHVVGWPAMWAYGPLMRHVAGAHYAARASTQRLAATKRSRRRIGTAEPQPTMIT